MKKKAEKYREYDEYNEYKRTVELLNSFIYQNTWRLRSENQLKEMKIGFLRMQAFLKVLGNPEKGINFVHVAGTSGKGSVASMIHNALLASGLTSGFYMSPHLTTAIERIGINEHFIGPDEFVRLTKILMRGAKEVYLKTRWGIPTYLEALTALALLAFKEKKVSWAVIETGSGGRFDSTNVIAPRVSVISNVSYDHLDKLGPTLKYVAWHKAGIIKRGVPVVLGVSQPLIRKVFLEEAEKKKAPVFMAKIKKDEFFQQKNTTLSLKAIEILGLSSQKARRAVLKTRIAGRFEIVASSPTVILDVAHNTNKIEAFVQAFREKFNNQKIILVFAVSESKDLYKMIKAISPLVRKIFITQPIVEVRTGADLRKIEKACIRFGIKKREIYLDPFSAFEVAQKEAASQKGVVVVIGSMFLVGNIREIWWPERQILELRKNI